MILSLFYRKIAAIEKIENIRCVKHLMFFLRKIEFFAVYYFTLIVAKYALRYRQNYKNVP